MNLTGRDGQPLAADGPSARAYERLQRINGTPEPPPAAMGTGQGSRTQRLYDSETRRLAKFATEAPRIPWDVFLRQAFVWKAGEHVGMIGPTGQGKTTTLVNILPLKPYVVVFGTKPRDSTMNNLELNGYLKLERWKSLDPERYPRRVLWPEATKLDSVSLQRKVFRDAFSKIYREGGWTVALDETWYIINTLKLEHAVKMFLLQARSLGVSLVAATQRPAYVPLEIYDQSTHLFFWRDNDERNLSRISGLSVQSSGLIRSIVSSLDAHQFLYVNTRTGSMVRTHSPKVEGI